jgi:hypothetical protein
MTGAEIYNALLQRGYDQHHAAALAGHALQESGGDPTNVNTKEDAHGLYQWRLDRWKGLQNYALSRRQSPDSPDVQLDFIAKEMSGPEAKSGAAFLASGDLPSASAALKRYIRFGDNSDDARLRYARGILDGGGTAGPAVGGNRVAASSGGETAPAIPGETPPPQDTGLTEALQAIPKQLAAQQTEAPQIAPIEMPQPGPTPAMIRARQLAMAMLSKPVTPGAPA